jgi:hypothetical protein
MYKNGVMLKMIINKNLLNIIKNYNKKIINLYIDLINFKNNSNN